MSGSSPQPRTAPYDSNIEGLLFQELTHRVSNELAGATMMVAAAAASAENPDIKRILDEVRGALQGFLRLHHLLRAPQPGSQVDGLNFLRELCDALRCSKLKGTAIELQLDERPLSLDSKQCWKLGMIVAELVANAATHAFAQNRGIIRIEATRLDWLVHCRVEDDGHCSSPIKPGCGLSIVAALARDLGGGIDLQVGPTGSLARLIFPAGAPQESDEMKWSPGRASESAQGKPFDLFDPR
jgi:two-component sensor histidine kinase